MRVIRKLCTFALILAISGAAQNTIQGNVQFTSMEGNSYDLYALLDNGKHVFVTFIKIFF